LKSGTKSGQLQVLEARHCELQLLDGMPQYEDIGEYYTHAEINSAAAAIIDATSLGSKSTSGLILFTTILLSFVDKILHSLVMY
jgi:hypothetical protein